MSSEPGFAIVTRAAQPCRPVASLTLGQTPRSDLMSDILDRMPILVEVQEFGALDGLTDRDIEALAPRADESSLVTRLRDGRDVIVSRQRVAERLEVICRSIDSRQFDLLIVLPTGLASMDSEESIRGKPIDGVVLVMGCDKTTPSLLMDANPSWWAARSTSTRWSGRSAPRRRGRRIIEGPCEGSSPGAPCR